MKITVMENEKRFDETAAWRIIGQMLYKPNSVIGFSTGQTTGNMHGIVGELYQKHPFDTSKLTIFNVDELVGLPRSYTGSCYAMIKRQICEPLEIPEENFIMPRTMEIDFDRECIWFEEEIEKGAEQICRCLESVGMVTSGLISRGRLSEAIHRYVTWTRDLRQRSEVK